MAASNRDDFDGYRKWLGIANQKRLPTHYELLAIGLDEDDPDVIQAAAEQRRHYVESKRGEGHDDLVTEILYRIDEAESTLLNTALRRDYDRKMDLFEKRRKSRQVDPVARRSGRSRGGRTVGEDGGIIRTFAAILGLVCVAFGGMAWFGSRVQQPKPVEIPPVAVPPAQVAQGPVAVIKAPEQPAQPPENPIGKFPKALLQLTFDSNQTAGVTPELHGARYVNGKVGKALEFDGSSFAVVNFNLPIGNASRSLAVWLKDTRGPLANRLVHPVTQGFTAGTAFGIMEASGKWRFFDFNGGLDSGFEVDTDWHHHCVTTDGTTITYHFDGVKVAEVRRALNTAVAPLMLGTYGDDIEPEKRFVGLIDQLMIFDVPITQEHIQSLSEIHSITDNTVDSLKTKLTGTKWINSNNVSFEWTKDGRFLHSGIEREWKVLDRRRVLITYGSAHSDTLVFNEDLTAFKQLIRGGPESFDGKLSSDLNSQAMKSLQGEWLLQTLNHDGKWIDEETLKAEDRLLTIVGDNFTLMRTKNGERNGHTGKIQFYSNGKFDFVGKGPGGNHIEWPGIYEVKGDTLKLHFWKSLSEGRPTDFVPIKGNLETYVRHDTTAKALKALQGEWWCIALNESGNQIQENALKAQNRRVTIDGDNFTLMRTRDGNRTGHIGKIQIGPNDTFDFVGKGPAGGNNEWPGIYEIKGDALKLRFANQLSDGRPKDFSPGQGNLEIYVRN